jgi:porin
MIRNSERMTDARFPVPNCALRATCIGVVFAISFLTTEVATAQIRDPESIFEYAEELEETRVDTHFGPSIIDRVFEPLKRFDAKMEEVGGPEVVGLYAPIWQTGTPPGISDLFSQSLNIYGEWELLRCPGNEGTLYLFYLHESDSLGNSAGQFADAVGTAILPNDDVGDATNALAHLAWTQKFLDGNVEFSVGQLALKIMIDQNDYAGWDRVSFVAGPLSGNQVRNFPIAALGVDTTVHLTDDLQLSMVVADADGYPFYPDFKSFGRRFVYIPGFVYTPDICGLGKGRYEVNFSHIERTERFAGAGPSSSVWLFSFQQELSPKLAAFFRFGTGDGRRTTVQQSLATGVVFTQAFGYNNDWLGVGFIWTDPSDGTRRDDYGMELFWRLQLTEHIQLTPDVQFYFDPSTSPNQDIEAAFGLRLGIYF